MNLRLAVLTTYLFNVLTYLLCGLVVVQVVNSTVGDVGDDPAGVQSNSPIAAPPEVEVVDETKYVVVIFFPPIFLAQLAERQHLRSASRRLLVVPTIQLDTDGRRAFAVVGPTVWNSLSNDFRDPDLSIASFGRLLKTHLLGSTQCTERIRGTVRR